MWFTAVMHVVLKEVNCHWTTDLTELWHALGEVIAAESTLSDAITGVYLPHRTDRLDWTYGSRERLNVRAYEVVSVVSGVWEIQKTEDRHIHTWPYTYGRTHCGGVYDILELDHGRRRRDVTIRIMNAHSGINMLTFLTPSALCYHKDPLPSGMRTVLSSSMLVVSCVLSVVSSWGIDYHSGSPKPERGIRASDSSSFYLDGPLPTMSHRMFRSRYCST